MISKFFIDRPVFAIVVSLVIVLAGFLSMRALPIGVRVLTNIVECDPASVAIGQAVEVVFHPTEKGPALPRFRPVG